jgi:hypothetical protein
MGPPAAKDGGRAACSVNLSSFIFARTSYTSRCRERNILIALSVVLLVGVAYLAGRLAFPELWPWF